MTFIPVILSAGADAWATLALSTGTAKGAERRRSRRLQFRFKFMLVFSGGTDREQRVAFTGRATSRQHCRD
jgi:hypothetical protein